MRVFTIHSSQWEEKLAKYFEFQNLYENLDKIKKDKKYETNRDEVFKKEALNNILKIKRNISFYISKNYLVITL